ncbi:MAG: SixA phosphatase family protein [Devosia sp.]
MTLRLLLLRHAKASHDRPGADRDRPLAPRGREAAAELGERMGGSGLVPRLVVCSPALRTRETLLGIMPALLPLMPDDAVIRLEGAFYGTHGPGYLSAIAGLGGRASPLLVVGHNPAIEDCANALLARPAPALGGGFPTAALAVLDAEIATWAELRPHVARLTDMLVPVERR